VISLEELRGLGLKLVPLLLVVLLPGGFFLAPFLLMSLRRTRPRVDTPAA